MAQISSDQIRVQLAEISARKAHYERKGNTPPDDRVAKRFRDIFINTTELTPDGKVGVHDFEKDDTPSQKFTHMLEEYCSRGGTPMGVIAAARKPVLRYFENGAPVGVKMFDGYQAPPIPFYVKYGRKQFLEPMLREGRIRICPATFYNKSTFLQSVQDDETKRTFFVPTFRERLAGKDSLDFQGRRIVFGDDDIILPVVRPDYFLFSLCDQIYCRLPTDFDADAALIIREPGLFTQRVISHFLTKRPDCEPLYGLVTYYDPYGDYSKIRVAEMSKHFGYAYQREVRIAFRPKHPVRRGLEPEFLKIGPMSDYAELVYA